MSQYYNGKRSRKIYDPLRHSSGQANGKNPFRLNRSKLERFVECPRCFYIDRRLGVDRPPGFPFTLNSAMDTLLKKEFDIYREKGEAHPLIKKYNVEAVPISHADFDV